MKSAKLNYNLKAIIEALNNHQIIAYPTEAVFGLGCNPDSEHAVKKLLLLKNRSWKKGFILIAAEYKQLIPYIDDKILSKKQHAAIFSSWPGPVTWTIPALPETPRFLTGRFNSLAVRVSAHPMVQQLCKKYGKPLISTSANFRSKNPCRNTEEVMQQFGYGFPILLGSVCGYLNTSEIRDALSGDRIR